MNKIIISDEAIIGKVYDIKEYCFEELEIAKKSNKDDVIERINIILNEINGTSLKSNDLIEIRETLMDTFEISKLVRKSEKESEREIFIRKSLNESIKAFEIDLNKYNYTIDDLIGIVDDYYFDTDIQITKICDIVVEHLNELDDEDFDIYYYTDDLC